MALILDLTEGVFRCPRQTGEYPLRENPELCFAPHLSVDCKFPRQSSLRFGNKGFCLSIVAQIRDNWAGDPAWSTELGPQLGSILGWAFHCGERVGRNL